MTDSSGFPVPSDSDIPNEMGAKTSIEWRSLPPVVKVALIASLVTMVSTFMDWANLMIIQVSGIETGYGKASLVGSGTAIAAYFGATRSQDRQKVLVAIATSGLLVSLGIHIYIGLSFAGMFANNEEEFFSAFVNRGFGFEIGIIASSVALSLSAFTAFEVFRGKALLNVASGWRLNESVGMAASASSLVMLVFYDNWLVPLVAGVVLAGLWYMGRQWKTFHTRVLPLMLTASVFTLSGAVMERLLIDQKSNSSTSDGSSAEALNLFTDSGASCSELFADGTDTDKAIAASSCKDEDTDTLTFVFTQETTCVDGSLLHFNNYGWGHAGEEWHADDGSPTPLGTCYGLAADRCSQAFPAGITTRKSWADDGVMCFSSDGETEYVISIAMDCFNSSKTYVYNDYGWGYVNEPWRKGDPSYNC